MNSVVASDANLVVEQIAVDACGVSEANGIYKRTGELREGAPM